MFFSPPSQPNETSMSLGYVQRAQQLVETRWVPAYDPELGHRANTPSAGQDSRCPTFYTISVRCGHGNMAWHLSVGIVTPEPPVESFAAQLLKVR